jgi:hypothetical protein
MGGSRARLSAALERPRRFDDLFNLVHDPATLIAAYGRSRITTARTLPAWTA